jgi:hypothetical protein
VFDDATGEARIARYEIGRATARALSRCGSVHETVVSVLAREARTYVGELVVV